MINQHLGRYDTYQDSEIEGLGKVPANWGISRIKERGSVKARVGWKALKASEYVEDGYAFLSTPNIKTKEIDFKNVNYITYERYMESPEIMLKKDDILLAKDGSTLGTVNIVTHLPRETTVNSSIGVLRFDHTIFNKYLFYQIESKYIQDKIKLKKSGMGVPHLFQQDINNFIILIPPLEEQKVIAKYLDVKTDQIDKKIELLNQKAIQYKKVKQSLVHESVTRGLDRTVSMKDSGIKWIGEIPEHWNVSSITNITSIVSKKNFPKEELLSVYRDFGVIIKSTRDDNHNKAGQDLSKYKLVEPGFLVINKMKAWQGSLGVSEFRGIVSPAYITCKTDGKVVERRYLHHLLRSRSYVNEYNRLSYGVRVDQWDMRYDDFKYVPVLLPPIEEQKAIATYLDSKMNHIDLIIETINSKIRKLRELRETLVNDVVTGKIKVAMEGVIV
ncbi:restriction endonuclease subunit S [Priestia megaterium]|uniref:restriction endonuclease subunit S n=1 Tax=Priestia megaterium TaxID=1404 RepID=UPI001E051FA5|nr:restriction endonuclease subunit S [Priestia megaterium]CAH0320253.1 Type-1 restriction enzyme EcoKI specificity protein [Priestia megaterium]